MRHATEMADALEDAGKPVELLIFENEIHGLRSEKHRLEFYEKLVSFFDRHTTP